MTFTLLPHYPFYGGAGASSEVPDEFDIALGGRTYMLDKNHPAFGGTSAYLGRMGIDTIPLIRQQADGSKEPGEGTINPEDLWPRSQSSWHKGAGQSYFDAPDSDRTRFRASLGLDPWTRNRLSLLKDTESICASVATNLQNITVNTYEYIVDGNNVYHSQSPYSVWTDAVIQAGEAAQSVKSITTDGYNVWAALGSNGIHTTTRGAVSSTHYSALSATLLGYVKGRLMAANGAAIYNVVASGAAPAALYTQPNSDFTWVGFAEGTGQIYAAGYSGDKSLIYRTAVKADGTSLDAPVVAGELPDGEIVRTICGYLGFLLIGTDKGFRVATQSAQGDLTLGALVNTGHVVRAFEPQDRFVWYSWENYDGTHTGLGRMDLSMVLDTGAPAYASDLMAASQGNVVSIATESGGRRVFAVSGVGYFAESSAAFVSVGTLDTGQIGFGIPDSKIALRMALKHEPLVVGGSVSVTVTPDQGAAVSIGISDIVGSTQPEETLKVPEVTAQMFELHLTLHGGSTALERFDFRGYPSSKRGETILVPILLHEVVDGASGLEHRVDVVAEYEAIKSYEGSGRLISYQELGNSYSVLVEEVSFQRHHAMKNRKWWNGVLLAKLKVLGE
jgi:hypothetical protein